MSTTSKRVRKPEADVTAWAREIERRARDALANPEDDIAWETVRGELHATAR
jgi:hypothetical protein